MKLSDFDFQLPKDLIAQYPNSCRAHSSLLIPNIHNPQILKFYDVIDYLKPGDVLVLNNSRVVKANIILYKDSKKININLNKPALHNLDSKDASYDIANHYRWLVFAKPAKKLHVGDVFSFGAHKILIKSKLDNGEFEIEFQLHQINVFDFLDLYGQVPLPQYIKREDISSLDNTQSTIGDDDTRYQNVYGEIQGSVAAPTAGLHFTQELLDQILAIGVEICFVTLHVGAGTFLPVKTQNIADHRMHSEWCCVPPEVAITINKAKQEKRRIVAVGTTVMRAIESCARDNIVFPAIMETDIFITPGYEFQVIDLLITNFHLPKSTLFMLVCAFAGCDEVHELYSYAIKHKMRFFSYGDAMILSKANPLN